MSVRVIITGGGTGGHIFPAISIANAIKARKPDAEILFVGAKGGMEMDVVPRYDYPIESVWISGIMRRVTVRNILKNMVFPIKLISSMMAAGKIIRRFKPDVVVGVGGYASGPVGRVAARKGIPLVICEQNAYPGITNKWLAPRAARILLGNEAAAKYFDASKSVITGNPVRDTLRQGTREKGLELYKLNPGKSVVLALGGSLGARTLNNALEKDFRLFIDNDIQLIWQCGKRYYEALRPRVPAHPNICLRPFIEDMANTYAAADLVISRAGGSTISELILLDKPAILVPSPNVAEDHQTKNALSLADRGAAVMVKDAEAEEQLASRAVEIMLDPQALDNLRKGIENVEKHDAANEIADEIFALIEKGAGAE